MATLLIDQLMFFQPVRIPVYIRSKIQECAINHLELRDMGQLRDRMEGQLYYNRLSDDIMAEYAFEKYIRLGDFDWHLRMNKNYKRKFYDFEFKNLNLIILDGETYPRFDLKRIKSCVFIYLYSESKAWISGLATQKLMEEFGVLNDNGITEIQQFENFLPFSNREELQLLLNRL